MKELRYDSNGEVVEKPNPDNYITSQIFHDDLDTYNESKTAKQMAQEIKELKEHTTKQFFDMRDIAIKRDEYRTQLQESKREVERLRKSRNKWEKNYLNQVSESMDLRSKLQESKREVEQYKNARDTWKGKFYASKANYKRLLEIEQKEVERLREGIKAVCNEWNLGQADYILRDLYHNKQLLTPNNEEE